MMFCELTRCPRFNGYTAASPEICMYVISITLHSSSVPDEKKREMKQSKIKEMYDSLV